MMASPHHLTQLYSSSLTASFVVIEFLLLANILVRLVRRLVRQAGLSHLIRRDRSLIFQRLALMLDGFHELARLVLDLNMKVLCYSKPPHGGNENRGHP